MNFKKGDRVIHRDKGWHGMVTGLAHKQDLILVKWDRFGMWTCNATRLKLYRNGIQYMKERHDL